MLSEFWDTMFGKVSCIFPEGLTNISTMARGYRNSIYILSEQTVVRWPLVPLGIHLTVLSVLLTNFRNSYGLKGHVLGK